MTLTLNVSILRCSFITESEQLCKQWVDAMQNAIHVALSNCDVAEQIWAEPSNSFCADCGIPKPEWAAINLCVVICNQCAGLFILLCIWLILIYDCILTFLQFIFLFRGAQRTGS